MSAANKEIAEHARFLRNVNPQIYEEFYRAFEKFTEIKVLAVVNATGDGVMRTQGHAQQCLELLRILEEVKNG